MPGERRGGCEVWLERKLVRRSHATQKAGWVSFIDDKTGNGMVVSG